MRTLVSKLVHDESGGSMVEYGVIAALIAAPAVVALLAISNTCGAVLNTAGTGLTSIAVTNP